MKLSKIIEEAGKALGITPEEDCGKKDVVCMIDKLKDRKKKIHHKLAKSNISTEKFESLKEDEENIKVLIKKAEKKLEKIEKEVSKKKETDKK
jgi:hypothetical protein